LNTIEPHLFCLALKDISKHFAVCWDFTRIG